MRLSGRKTSSSAARWRPRQRVVFLSLLGLNCAVFFGQQLLQLQSPEIIPEYLGLSYRGIDEAYAWQFLTALFLQVGIFQFAASMLIFFFLGRDLESILGQRHFLYLYLLGAIGGELGHLFLMPPRTVLLAGAGGVAAIVVAFGTILPELELSESIFFILPVKLRAKHFAVALAAIGAGLMIFDRRGVVGHSAILGGCVAGWLYAHLLGFGRPSILQRVLRRRRLESEREQRLSPAELIAEKIDPLLEKISRSGFASLTRRERRSLARARERMIAPTNSGNLKFQA
jgi:membrane associated rhomboid family serine protease